jgi:uncharacterized membrane protein YdbT with pleckstrin-like domain
MGYVEQNLMPGERILVKARLHWALFLGPIIVLLGGVLIAAALGFAGYSLLQTSDSSDAGMALLVCCLPTTLLVGVLSVGSALVTYFSTEFALTDRRIIAKSGFLRRRSLEILLSKVESIGVTQPLVGRALDYGTVVVSGSGGTKQGFPNIANPMDLRNRINDQIARIE